ncbi:MAG: hypothetical protein ACYSWX_14630 [Planctomycetota bacterium]|jgi:hypothetical protein
MNRTVLFVLPPLALAVAAPAVAQDTLFEAVGPMHEFVEPWFEGLEVDLQVEHRVEHLVEGEWQVFDGFESTWGLEARGFTSTEYALLTLTARNTVSLREADVGGLGLADRVVGLADGLALDVLCDWYGVPERALGYVDFGVKYSGRRAELVRALTEDERTAPVVALVGPSLPTVDVHLAQTLELLENWAIPIGYTLEVDEPFEFETWLGTSWSTVNHPGQATYRLEELDELNGQARLSYDLRQAEGPESILPSTPELARSPAANAPLVIERADWVFDTYSGLPMEYRRVTFRQQEDLATRVTTEFSVVEDGSDW